MNNVFLDVFKKYLNEDGIYYDDYNNKPKYVELE
jgi:hypothetical protein